ncbi:STAS domain-containing protein [Neobacillus terrae]|uniref:STAS domain-containing protein n=1 Tax=Neobacillus terrae TaxID=3034837 RepID=UPI00140854F9|nr:STAS domain-containing protein [Neobacillus terrae]NHM32694.1 STAS domain-containing protein [Neobacillus terrae]
MKLGELKKEFSKRMYFQSEEIARGMIDGMLKEFHYQFKNKEEEEQTFNIFLQCVHIIAEGLQGGNVLNRASAWGEAIGKLSIENNGELGPSLLSVSIYKKAILFFIQRETRNMKISFEMLVEMIADIDHIFNLFVYGFSNAFTQNAEYLLEKSEQLYLKISVPIVPISKATAVLPLIGEINEIRSETIIQDTLEACVKNRFETLVIDLSGVYEVDLVGIEVLYKLIRSLNLLGVTPLVTGMSASISKTFAELGISLSNVQCFHSLEQALKTINLY